MTSDSPSLPLLDHLVILVSQATLLGLPERLQDVLVVAPGGTHADGVTMNKLILFEDGFYIELIAFVDGKEPEHRQKHRWGHQKENSVIDWAYTFPSEDDFYPVKQRLQRAATSSRYSDPIPGGRIREDGTVLKWAVAVAQDDLGDALQPGILPFWCLDRTPRRLRVPYQEDSHQTQHPSGVRGISSITVTVPTEQLKDLAEAYSAIHDRTTSTHSWHFGVPNKEFTTNNLVSLLGSDRTTGIYVKLKGSPGGASSVELLPGVVFDIEQ
ncbi:glyoxalase/Bleomycin resistance protein/Dioxygenase superfamily [Pochonia chlamydosporia 170]|uniref:Glyoxalase/Bleomycin resistance protein/Dioxygenase superfamily n=1 Tax=Pochonia chlamydosporia 170 TaxID=1380566 RepID=A0A179FEE4_METCM|nr:glyoxalase/Bleomycin resistance protein/Dioxygenase superfamily [Pochonia chlamydosporia 170]OAQ63680.1 glyoxalase/Bleomycin resistance protein/Dioxygenase superfamily [Pochonia chlamydosporia 170]